MNAPPSPRVSVIIPCYNQGEFLDEAVGSVLAQTFDDFEIIVVDDGSTEEATQAILANYRRPKTRVVRAQHQGLAATRNLAISESSGAYLCALDADDRLDASFLAKTAAVLDRDPSVTFVSTWLRTFGDETWDWTPARCDLPALLSEDTVLTASLVRRDAVLAVGGYDTAMPVQGDEDWDLWLTLVERGYTGVILPEVLFHYRRRAGSMSTVAWYGPGHMPLARYRVAKHEASYRSHLLEVLLRQDVETAALLRRNDELERHLTTFLEPAVAARRDELEAMRSRANAESTTDRTRELESAARAAYAEIHALRSSTSWRVTAPGRKAYEWWLRLRGRA
jgi:glycosyltransferase involved in cell wall biosynthesis